MERRKWPSPWEVSRIRLRQHTDGHPLPNRVPCGVSRDKTNCPHTCDHRSCVPRLSPRKRCRALEIPAVARRAGPPLRLVSRIRQRRPARLADRADQSGRGDRQHGGNHAAASRCRSVARSAQPYVDDRAVGSVGPAVGACGVDPLGGLGLPGGRVGGPPSAERRRRRCGARLRPGAADGARHRSDRHRLRIPLSADALGNEDIAEIQITVDRTFVPANLLVDSRDARELGIQVYHAAVERDPSSTP